MKNLPDFLIRPDDYEVFSRNLSSDTYSSYIAKEKFPYSYHHKYPYQQLIDLGFLSFFGTCEQLLKYLSDRVTCLDPKIEMPVNKLSSLEERLDRIEKILLREFNKKCVHEFETVGGVNTNYKHYYSGAHSYIKCLKCGDRVKT